MNVLEKNVVERLRNRVREAKQAGFRVRMEYLEDETATWCVIGGVKTIFIDLSQTAAEQLGQLNESMSQIERNSADAGLVGTGVGRTQSASQKAA